MQIILEDSSPLFYFRMSNLHWFITGLFLFIQPSKPYSGKSRSSVCRHLKTTPKAPSSHSHWATSHPEYPPGITIQMVHKLVKLKHVVITAKNGWWTMVFVVVSCLSQPTVLSLGCQHDIMNFNSIIPDQLCIVGLKDLKDTAFTDTNFHI